MRLRLAALIAACLASTALAAPVPKEQLMKPPADAERFAIVSQAGEHGTSELWRTADGSIASRQSLLLRGFVWEIDQKVKLGEGGMPTMVEIRGVNPGGDAAETFNVADGKAHWKSPIDAGEAAFQGKSFYLPQGGTWASNALLVESLFKAPGQKLALLPGGEARLVKLTDLNVGQGDKRKTVTAYAIEGLSLEPLPVWVDDRGKFFAFASTMGLMPVGYEKEFERLKEAQIAALAKRSPEIAQRFAGMPRQPVAFTNVRMFDAEQARFLDGQTVVASGGKIAAVGPAGSVMVPANARVIDGAGKTLVPGLWDAHMHAGSDAQGVMLLSMGMTSGRDPGADIQQTLLRRDRIAKGELLFPTLYSSVLIDGKGPLQAQGGISVNSAEEAVAGVRKAHENGFTGVKFYTSMKPEWLKAGIAEAKKLGLHVHGHVPATMRPADAIAAGYDEITHINFVMMQAMPDEVVEKSNGMARFQGPGRYAKDVDLDAEPIKSLIAEMARRKIVSDPTLAVFETSFARDNGELAPAYAPFAGTLPPTTERDFRGGADAPPEGVSREDYARSFAKLVALTGKMHEAGVPIVAGTDGWGIELIRDLELLVEAGLTPAEALQAATLVPARLVGADATTGSIAVGKEADLVLVDGDPSRRIGELRKTDWVMSDGRLMNADELRSAAGFTGRPK